MKSEGIRRHGFASLILVFIAVFSGWSHADEIGISSARLIEEPDRSSYLLEVDVPPAMVGAIQSPIVPERFSVAPKPEVLQRGAYLTLRYSLIGEPGTAPLTGADRLLLPWARAGVSLEVFWQDEPPQRLVFAASGPQGIDVPLSAIRPEPVTRSRVLREAFLAGLRWFGTHWIHAALILSFVLVAPGRAAFRLTLGFAVGHALSMVAFDLRLPALPPELAEAALGLGIVVLVREALLDRETLPGRNFTLVVILGLLHGLGIAAVVNANGSVGSHGLTALFAFNLAIDLVQVLATAIAVGWLACVRKTATKTASRVRLVIAMTLGSVAAAFTLLSLRSAAENPRTEHTETRGALAAARFDARSPSGAGGAALAPRGLSDPVMSYLTVEGHEVRHEILVHLGTWMDREDPSGFLPLEGREALQEELLAELQQQVELRIDGVLRPPDHSRVDFVEVLPTGVLTRSEPQAEPWATATLGVSMAWETAGPPRKVEMVWKAFPERIPAIPVTLSDPMGAERVVLDSDQAGTTWTSDDATLAFRSPEVRAIPVRVPHWPFLSLTLGIGALVLVGVNRFRARPLPGGAALPALCFAAAILAYPFVRTPARIPLIGSGTPSPEESTTILRGLLENTYRALDFRNESVVYDRLAVSLTGERLTETYLDLRRAFELENRGGARARVDQLEILGVDSVEPGPDGGVVAHARWRASGRVSHFGHTHYRQNVYEGTLSLVPLDGTWKIRGIDLIDERRVY